MAAAEKKREPTYVSESSSPHRDFILFRNDSLSEDEKQQLRQRMELAKYGKKWVEKKERALRSSGQVGRGAFRRAQAIDAKPLYRTHTAEPPSHVAGASLVLAPHGDATRLTVTSSGCDEYYGIKLSERPKAAVRVTVSARSPLVEVRPCEFGVEADDWDATVQVAVLSVTENQDDPRAVEHTRQIAVRHFCHSVDDRFNKAMPTLYVNFVSSTSKSLVSFGAGGSGQRGERGARTRDNYYQMQFPKHCDDAMARMAGVAHQLCKLSAPAQQFYATGGFVNAALKDGAKAESSRAVQLAFGYDATPQSSTLDQGAETKKAGGATNPGGGAGDDKARETVPRVVGAKQLLREQLAAKHNKPLVKDDSYPPWYDLGDSVADNISSDSDIAPDRETVRRYAQEKGATLANFKGSYLGRFPLVSADFSTSDHRSERSRT